MRAAKARHESHKHYAHSGGRFIDELIHMKHAPPNAFAFADTGMQQLLIFDRVGHIFILGKHASLPHTHELFIPCMPSSKSPSLKSIAAHGRQSKIEAASSYPRSPLRVRRGQPNPQNAWLNASRQGRERRTETLCIRRAILTRHETSPIIIVAYLLNGGILKIK
jgi:hypothetical protein